METEKEGGERMSKTWKQIGKTIKVNGEKTIVYELDTDLPRIESRTESIPHSNRSGVWFHTSYFAIEKDGTEKEYYRLQDAKKAVEGR